METTGFIYDTEALIQRTSLDRKFVERCNAELATALDPYRMRGDNNKWLYNSSGLLLFDEIARLKGNSATLPDIERHLISLGIAQEPTSESLGNVQEALSPSSESIAAIQDAHREVLAAKDESLRLVQDAHRRLVEEKERQIGTLNQSIQLLTDGRSPEQIQAQRKAEANRQAERQRLVAELSSLERGLFNRARRRAVIDRLAQLDSHASSPKGN